MLFAVAVTAIGPGFWAAVIASLLSAGILGALALGRKTVRNDVVLPIKRLDEGQLYLQRQLETLESDFHEEKDKRRRFQKRIVKRIDLYEEKAAEERRRQVAMRRLQGSETEEQHV